MLRKVLFMRFCAIEGMVIILEKIKEVLRKIGSTIFAAAVIVLIVAALGIGFGLLTQRQLILSYAFVPNFIVSAIIIATGIIGPPMSRSVMDFIRTKASQHTAIITNETYTDRMEERKQKRKRGREFLWIGIACALITGGIEILLWWMA